MLHFWVHDHCYHWKITFNYISNHIHLVCSNCYLFNTAIYFYTLKATYTVQYCKILFFAENIITNRRLQALEIPFSFYILRYACRIKLSGCNLYIKTWPLQLSIIQFDFLYILSNDTVNTWVIMYIKFHSFIVLPQCINFHKLGLQVY